MNLIKYFIILIVLLSLHACNNQNFYQNEVRKFCDTLILAQDSIQRHIPAGKLNYSTFKIIQSKLAKNGRYKDIFSLFNANSIPIADNIAGFELSFNHCKEIFIERKYNLRKTNDMSIRLRLTYFDGVYAVFVDGHNVFILNNKTKLIICLKTASVDNYKPFGLLKIYYLNDQLFPIFALEQGHPDTHKGLEDYLLYFCKYTYPKDDVDIFFIDKILDKKIDSVTINDIERYFSIYKDHKEWVASEFNENLRRNLEVYNMPMWIFY